jgi:hypothetical protein
MDVGLTLRKVAQAGSTAVTRTWSALSRTAAFLAQVTSFVARQSERMAVRFRGATARLERTSRWLRAKALRVPLGADLAGTEWEEPTLLPVAAEPPPIPPAAFFKSRPAAAQEEDWGAAIMAAKLGATPAPSTPQSSPDARTSATHSIPSVSVPAPAPSPPRTPEPRLVSPRTPAPTVTFGGGVPLTGGAALDPKPVVDSQSAAATRRAIATALRLY